MTIRADRELFELERRVRLFKRGDPKTDARGILRDAVTSAQDRKVRFGALLLLAGECQIQAALNQGGPEAVAEARQSLEEATRLCPESSLAWILMAEHLQSFEHNLEAAAGAARTAVDKAGREAKFVRQALGVQIRIAARRNDFARVESCLNSLLEYVPPRGTVDISMESDFLHLLPEGAVDPDLIRRYRERVAPNNG